MTGTISPKVLNEIFKNNSLLGFQNLLLHKNAQRLWLDVTNSNFIQNKSFFQSID